MQVQPKLLHHCLCWCLVTQVYSGTGFETVQRERRRGLRYYHPWRCPSHWLGVRHTRNSRLCENTRVTGADMESCNPYMHLLRGYCLLQL